MKLNRRHYHRFLVIREKSNKRLSREVDPAVQLMHLMIATEEVKHDEDD